MGMCFAFCRMTRLIWRGGFAEDLRGPADGIALGNQHVRSVIADIEHRTEQSANGPKSKNTTDLADTRQHVDCWPKISNMKDR